MNAEKEKLICKIIHRENNFEAEVSFNGGQRIYADYSALGSAESPVYLENARLGCVISLPPEIDFGSEDTIKILHSKFAVKAKFKNSSTQSCGQKIAFCDVLESKMI